MSKFKRSPHGQRNTDLEAGGSHSNGAPPSEDDEESSGPFDITRTKNASVERIRQWRKAALELNAGRRFRFTNDEFMPRHLRKRRNASVKLDRLRLQLWGVPVDSVSAPPTISEIHKSIIPVVVLRVQLAYKNFLYLHPRHKNDSNSGKQGSSHFSGDDYESINKRVEMLTHDLGYIRSFLMNLEENSNNLRDRLDNLNGNASGFIHALLQFSAFDHSETDSTVVLGDELFPAKQLRAKKFPAQLDVFNKVVIKMKHEITSCKDTDKHWYSQVLYEFDYSQVLDTFPVLHVYKRFRDSLAFQEFRVVYESLELTTKMCLLCFAIIPENEVVKKRFMTHWWVAESFVNPPDEAAAADGIFKELVKKNCIEPVNDKYRFAVDSYKMNPLIRSAVIVLAKKSRFFDFDDKGNPSANFKSSYRACLVDGFSRKSKIELETDLDPEKLQVIFNVNEPYPDFFQLKWFSKLKNVKVLYLGRWQTSANQNIEVQSIKFLTGLKSMKLLRFLSLQGISGIVELPRSVCRLPNLRILDLRACHDLEALPDGIESLRMLTHLDISECYLLDYMPKGIATLSQLQVLKGFVISEYRNSSRANCTLDHLSRLEELRKLTIYTNNKAFPDDADVTILLNFKALQKLTITWGERAFLPSADSNAKRDTGVAQPEAKKIVFETLEKLDLKRYPFTTAPSWLRPRKFLKLKKLYIREGNLQNLCPVHQENDKWLNVEALRLKFLRDLKMDWKKLRSSFPGLIYLEIFECPRLTYFPCGDNGVLWLKP